MFDISEKPDVTGWNVDGRILNSNTNSIELIKLNAHNISLTYFDKQNNGSIYVCKLEEKHQLEWAISIIDHTAACSEVNLSKRLSRHTVCGTGNPTITEIIEKYSATECPSVNIKSAVNVTLCDAFNRDDMGARQFLGNVRGSFKLEVLNPAIVRKFYIEEFGVQTKITINETRNVTFICDGDGNPPPTLMLVSTSSTFTTRYSPHLEHTIQFSSSRDTDTYLCIASNGLGNDSKSMYVDVITFKGEDGSSPITILLCVGSAIIILIIALYLLKRRYEMLRILHIKDVTIELATVEEVNQTSSSPHNNGFMDHTKRLGKETSDVAVQGIPGVCNELYDSWAKPSTSRTDNTRNKDDMKKEQQNRSFVSDDIKNEQGYKTRRNQNELGDCTYSVVNKKTQKHIDHASKDSVSSKANIIQTQTDGIYSMAKEPNEKDSVV